MSAFVSKEKVPVTIDGQNVIYIRPKMTLGMQTRIVDGLKMRNIGGNAVPGVGEGEALMLLLAETVVDWDGPDFKDDDGEIVPVNRVTLENMDFEYPLFTKVTEHVKDLYTKATEGISPNLPKPKRTGRNTSKP